MKLGMTRAEVEASERAVRPIAAQQYLAYLAVLGTECLPDPADREIYKGLGFPEQTELSCDVLTALGSVRQLQYRALFFFARNDNRLDTIQITTDLLRPEVSARVMYAELVASIAMELGAPTLRDSGRIRGREGKWHSSPAEYCRYLQSKRAGSEPLTERDFIAPRVDWSLWRQPHAEVAIRIFDTFWRSESGCPKPEDNMSSGELAFVALPFAMIQIQLQRIRDDAGTDPSKKRDGGSMPSPHRPAEASEHQRVGRHLPGPRAAT